MKHLLAFLIALCLHISSASAADEPNILVIVADDMGYSDISCFGGEIKTPHIDSLAKSGIRATNFYVAPTCSPTRSMLLSGCDHHVAGFGNMDELVGPKQKGKPGYEGYLNDRVVPVAKVLRDAGYHTYWAGKSHMGYEPSQWPAAMGFERDFTLLQGGGSNWSDMTYPNPAHPKLTFTLIRDHSTWIQCVERQVASCRDVSPDRTNAASPKCRRDGFGRSVR